ncbi:glycosyltransferase family 4 protein [Candidatus Peribacteria bacterium]|nr:glycosyltransferase family 4 protein [Candidatus Peribacteria bacterium]
MPLHTLMFGWEYPPRYFGGLGVACQGLVRGLLRHGVQVTLVLPHGESTEPGVDIRSFASADPLRILSVPSVLRPYDSPETFHTHTGDQQGMQKELYGRNLGEAVEHYTATAVALTNNVNPDIVHTHDWMTMEAGARASKHHDCPLVAHIHATELDRTEFHPNEWIFKREIEGLTKAHHVIAVSQYTKNLLVKEYGIDPDKIGVVHNGSEAQPFLMERKEAESHPLVLFLGRLTVQKGVQYFLRAARIVLDHSPGVRFVVAGEGYLLPDLIAESLRLGLNQSIIFSGHVSSQEAATLFSKAACFVMPSVSEPFGLVALEAITHGAPVILSRQSGASEVVSNALLVDFWDTDRMADCILTVLREQVLGQEMRAHSSGILKRLTWKTQAKHLLAIYHSLLLHRS